MERNDHPVAHRLCYIGTNCNRYVYVQCNYVYRVSQTSASHGFSRHCLAVALSFGSIFRAGTIKPAISLASFSLNRYLSFSTSSSDQYLSSLMLCSPPLLVKYWWHRLPSLWARGPRPGAFALAAVVGRCEYGSSHVCATRAAATAPLLLLLLPPRPQPAAAEDLVGDDNDRKVYQFSEELTNYRQNI